MTTETDCDSLLEGIGSETILEGLIRRTGVSLNIRQFMCLVSVAYHQAQKTLDPHLDMPLRFRNSRSYYGFSSSLRLAELDLRRSPSVLVVGCGVGYAGCSSDYAVSVAQDVLSSIRSIDRLELSPAALDDSASSRTYDLVISHSLAHFVLDLEPLFKFLTRRVARGGALVMGHEPNAAFWSDRRVTTLRQVHQQRRRIQRGRSTYLKPSAYVARLRRLLRNSESPSIFYLVNELLRNQHRFRAELTPAEIVAIVDPHLPSSHAFRVGLRGLDAERLRAAYMPEFSLRWLDTSEYQGIDEGEAMRLGLPGSIFSALYRNGAAA